MHCLLVWGLDAQNVFRPVPSFALVGRAFHGRSQGTGDIFPMAQSLGGFYRDICRMWRRGGEGGRALDYGFE